MNEKQQIELNEKLLNALNGIGGNLDNISALIEAGANVNAVDENGRTPLQIAAQDGRTGLVELLVKKGANVHAKDNRGNTPLRLAIMSGYTKCAEFLIKHTISENHQTEKPDFLSDESYRLDCNRGYLEKMSQYWDNQVKKENFLDKNQEVFNHMSKHRGYVIKRDESLDNLRSDAGKFLKETLGMFYIKGLSETGNYKGLVNKFLSEPNAEQVKTERAID